MERNRQSEAHSLSRDSNGKDLVRTQKEITEPGSLTSWGRWRQGLVRTRQETASDRARRTHSLEMAERGTCQGTEGN